MGNRALLVGINRYRLPGSDLQGCVNDVTNVRDVLLKYFGFKVKDIRVLADDRATRAGILKRLEWLVKKATAGDRLLFHFSGHGSQIRDRNGDELKDRMDEILCPHDMDWDGSYIMDDDLEALFSGLPEGCPAGSPAGLLPLRNRNPGGSGLGAASPGAAHQEPVSPSAGGYPDA